MTLEEAIKESIHRYSIVRRIRMRCTQEEHIASAVRKWYKEPEAVFIDEDKGVTPEHVLTFHAPLCAQFRNPLQACTCRIEGEE